MDFVFYEVIGKTVTMRDRKATVFRRPAEAGRTLGRASAIRTKCLLLDEPFEGIAPALSERISDVLASLKGKGLTVLMSQSDLNRSHSLFDAEFIIERGANFSA